MIDHLVSIFNRISKLLLVTLTVTILGEGIGKVQAADSFSEGRNVDTRLESNWSQRENDQFYAVISFQIAEGWHTYWRNPGTTGMATEVNWKLPEGMKVEAVYESIPHRYENQGLIDYVHEGSAIIVAAISIRSDLAKTIAQPVISATVNWLECETLCVPGHSELVLKLTNETHLSPELQAEVSALIAHSQSTTSGQFQISDDQVTFEFLIDENRLAEGKSVYFFTETAINDAAAEQSYQIAADRILVTTAKTPYGAPEIDIINGWLKIKTLENSATYRCILEQGKIQPIAGSNKTASVETSGFFSLLILAFLGGMILNLMPCVFPVIGLKIMGFVEQAGQDRKKIILHGLIFTAGVVVSFWMLSAALLLLRAGGQQLGWGFQLQEPWFNYGLILLMLAFALSLNGVFEFGMSAVGVGSGLQRKSGTMGSFFSGVLATVVATPCSAPFLAPALGAALALAPWQAMILFTFIALGLSTPYLLLSAFPGTLKILPKPGAWMETFKQFMAFPLYATVAYLIWALIGQIDDANQLNLLLSLALFAMAFWVFGRWAAPHHKKSVRRTAITLSLLMVAASVFIGHPKAKKEFWEPWSPETVERHVADGKTVYVDFTARWCATCQLNKRVVFSSKEVLKAFESNNVVALKADWTNRDERITRRLKSLGKAAVPVNLVYKNGENEPVILPEVLTPGIVLEALNSN